MLATSWHVPCLKRSGQELRQALLRKMWNQMGSGLLALIGVKVLIMMTSLHFRYSRPPDVDGIYIFDEDDQLAKH